MSQRLRYAPSGINTDVDPAEAGDEVYSWAENIVFHDGRAERIGGLTNIFPGVLTPPKFLIETERGNKIFWVYAGEENIGVWDGILHHDLTPVIPIIPNNLNGEWTGGTLNGLPVLNNGASTPMFWDEDPLNPFIELPDWPVNTTCLALRPFKYHLFALGIQDGADFVGDKMMWSSAADEGAVPAFWSATPENEAGDDLLSETRGPIIDAWVLRGSLLIYKANSTYQTDYIGGNAVFSTRLLFETSGVLARNCVVEVAGVHYVFTAGDLIRHDGHSIQSLSDGRIRSTVFKQMDPINFGASFVAWDPIQRAVWFCFPTVGHVFPNLAAVYSLDEDAWGLRDLHNNSPYATFGILNVGSDLRSENWEDDLQAWELDGTVWYEARFDDAVARLIQCDFQETKLYAVDVGNTNDLTPVAGILEKLTMDLGDDSVLKTVVRIRPRNFGIAESINIRLGSQDAPDAPVEWGPVREYLEGDDKLDYIITGRYISIEFSGDSVQQWGLYSFEFEFNPRGAF